MLKKEDIFNIPWTSSAFLLNILADLKQFANKSELVPVL